MKNQFLREWLSYNCQWVDNDFVNYGVVDDASLSVRVNQLSEEQAKIALGICLKQLKKTFKTNEKIKDLLIYG